MNLGKDIGYEINKLRKSMDREIESKYTKILGFDLYYKIFYEFLPVSGTKSSLEFLKYIVDNSVKKKGCYVPGYVRGMRASVVKVIKKKNRLGKSLNNEFIEGLYLEKMDKELLRNMEETFLGDVKVDICDDLEDMIVNLRNNKDLNIGF